MAVNKTIHLEKPNTLSQFLSKKEQQEVVSLKITGLIGRQDFDDVLDYMCDSCGYYDDDDNYIPDYNMAAAIRHLDLGEATYVDGDDLPYFGYHSQLESIILPKGIKSTLEPGETALSESENLKTLVLPEGLKKVGGFNSCEKLKDLVLPEGLEEIKSFAFCGCESITSIKLPKSLKRFDGSCFGGCNIRAYEIDVDNSYYSAIDGVIYSKDLVTLVAFPSAYPNKHFTVPATTRIIGDCAFMYSQIDSIELPDSLTTIEGWAFQGSRIQSIVMPDSITEIGELAFRWCGELKDVQLSKGLIELPQQAFSGCPRLNHLVIPSTIETIHFLALLWAGNLNAVMQSAVPPKITGITKVDPVCFKYLTFFVPNGALSTYRNAPGWKSFKVKEIKE